MPATLNRTQVSSTRLREITQQCVKCGLCLPLCPTYQLSKTEAESPRGRIAIAQALLNGADVDSSSRAHLSTCLTCGACQSVCPSRVPYQELIAGVRAQIGSSKRESLRRSAARHLLEHPRLLRLMMPIARWFHSPLRRARSGSAVVVRDGRGPITASSGRIALIAGCTGDALDAQALGAAERLLLHCGLEVHRLAPQCCGALARHSGDLKRAESLGAALLNTLTAAAVAHCTGIATGCAAHCVELTRQQVPYRDPMEVLWSHRAKLRFRPDRRTVALHLPCTQRMSPSSVQATQDLLRLVPDLKLVTLAHRGRCCGGAGTYFLDHAITAAQLRQPILDDLARSGAQLVLSANIGCRLQIANGRAVPVQRADFPVQRADFPVQHPLEFLNELLQR